MTRRSPGARIIVTFRQAKGGVTVAELCHKGGIRDAPAANAGRHLAACTPH